MNTADLRLGRESGHLVHFLILEHVRDDVPWRRDIVDEPIETQDGYVHPPTRPGIGLEFVEEVAVAHVGGSPRPHLAFAPDGALLDW
jgi:galactonate dehydratase